jgi:hypothetical protein
MDAMRKPIDHARCRELAHPDIVNFAVSVYVEDLDLDPTYIQLARV